MRKLRGVLIISSILLSSCAPYQPRLGMTYQEWRNHWEYSNNWGYPRLVGGEGNTEVWTLDDGVFLYFENDQLVKVDQGQKFQERYQVEIINR